MSDDTPIAPVPDPAPAALPPPPVSRRTFWSLVAVGAALLIVGAWVVAANLPRFLTTRQTPSTDSATGGRAADARKIQATLFYVSEDGTALVPVRGDVLYGATPTEQARRIAEAQVQSPVDPLKSAIPAGTTVRAVFLTEAHEAFVDLGGAIVSGHQGGSLDEALTVYAIVNALTTNLPDIVSVQILVEGKQVDTLVGHLDLRYPLAKATDWIRKEQ